jgi:predicted ribosome quality control (RQC) complex YloA/Tae2 family protein
MLAINSSSQKMHGEGKITKKCFLLQSKVSNTFHTHSSTSYPHTFAISIAQSGFFEYIVDNFMLSNYHTLRYAVSTLASVLPGKSIASIFSQEKDEAVVTFSGLEECLILSCHPGINTLYMRPGFSRARANSVDVLPTACNRKIISASVTGSDRVVKLSLECGYSLYARFFGARANVLCTDATGRIVDVFKQSKETVGSHFVEPAPGFPVYDAEGLGEYLRGSQENVTAALKSMFSTLGSTVVREVLFRAGISSTCAGAGLDSRGIRSLGDALASTVRDLDNPAPRIYYRRADDDESIPIIFSIIPLRQAQSLMERMFHDVHDALRQFIAGRRRVEGVAQARDQMSRSISRRVERAERTLAAIRQELEGTDREEEYRRAGSLILSHVHILPRGSTSASFNDGLTPVEVRLDAALTPAQNAQRYYDKAKRVRMMRAQGRERIHGLEETLAMGTRLLAAITRIHTRHALHQFMEQSSDELEDFGLTRKGQELEQLPFRVFTVDGGFQVLAGKSSANNDLLTMKYAKPKDLWFHARGAGGSHVVLRVGTGAGEPSKKAKEQAAAIAAYYSKMRNAKSVPVAMTERKYVRKPKGAPAGTVTLERERVLFATPSLPGVQQAH